MRSYRPHGARLGAVVSVITYTGADGHGWAVECPRYVTQEWLLADSAFAGTSALPLRATARACALATLVVALVALASLGK